MNRSEFNFMQEEIREIIKNALEELNEQLDNTSKISYGEQTRLTGAGAVLDSMDFVTLITIIEELLEEKFGRDLRLVSDKAFSVQYSPFKDFSTLEQFILDLLNER